MNRICNCTCTPRVSYSQQSKTLINDYYAIKTNEKTLQLINYLENDEDPDVSIKYIQKDLEIFVYSYSDQYNEKLLSSVYKIIFGHLSCRNNVFEYIDTINRISHARTIRTYTNRCYSDDLYKDNFENIYFSKVYNDMLKVKNKLNIYDPSKITDYQTNKNMYLYDKYTYNNEELTIPESFLEENDIEFII